MEPYAGHALGILGWAYQQDGRLDRAIETLERAVELSRKAPIGVSTLGIAYAQAGRVAEAEAVARQLIEHESQSYVPPAAIAGVLAALDRMDEAGPWVEGAFRDRNPHIVLLGLWPGLRPLRADPGYVRRLEDAGFGYLLERMDADQP
jgi:tetratricopeptide (TPR) repeat protein